MPITDIHAVDNMLLIENILFECDHNVKDHTTGSGLAVQSIGSTPIQIWKTKHGQVGWIQAACSETSCLRKVCIYLWIIMTIKDKPQKVHVPSV